MDGSIEERVADYLRLEYGEDINDSGSIKTSDIKHIGHFVIGGIPTDYFIYPQTGQSR